MSSRDPNHEVIALVIKRMSQLGLTGYQVGQAVSGVMAPSTFYRFIKGEADMSASNLMTVFAALDIELSFRPRR